MKIFYLIIISLLINCSSVQKNFAGDRGNDFGDIASISLDKGLGIQISVGPLSSGIGINCVNTGYKYAKFLNSSDYSETFILGYKNNQLFHSEDFVFTDSIPQDDYYILRNKTYRSSDPFKKNLYGRIKIRAGLLFGATVEFNFYELFDFIVGFWGYDPLDDDWNTYYEKIIQAEKAKRNIHAQPIKSK